MRRPRRALTAALIAIAAGLGPVHAGPPACPLVADPAGDVVPGLVVVPLGDESGLDIEAVDVSVGPTRLSTTIWLAGLDRDVPWSGSGTYYDVTFRVGRATLWTHVFHWTLNTSFDAGWIEEDGTGRYFSEGGASGTYDPESGMVRVSFDLKALEGRDVVPGDPHIRNGTTITEISAETRRDTPRDDAPADSATSRATYRVGQKSCPPYRLDLA
jgi:hypothetical protein